MPVRKGKDSEGVYFRWGQQGKKYYVKDYITDACDYACAELKAKKKALAQGRAAFAAGYRGGG